MKKFLRMTAIILCVCLFSQLFTVYVSADEVVPLSPETTQTDGSGYTDAPAEPAYIISEDVSKRTETEKHFRMSDGTYTAATYNYPVHYRDESGEWADIDNSLVSVNEDELSNKSAGFDVVLSKKMRKDKAVQLEINGHKLSWGFVGANKSPAEIMENNDSYDGDDAFLTLGNIRSKTVYRDIYQDVDAEYIISSEGIKENIILKSSLARNEFDIEYKINGLTATVIDDKTIELTDSDGNFIYSVNAPVMMDADGNCSNELTLSVVSNKNSKLLVRLTADKDWLGENGRAYPVVVDPFVHTKQKSSSIASASMLSYYSASSYPHGSLWVGRDSSSYGRTTSALKHDLPTLANGDMVTYASLSLWTYRFSGTSKVQVNVSRITVDWSEYELRNSASYGTLSRESKIQDFNVFTSANNSSVATWDVTGIVKKWYNEEERTNYGILLWADDPDSRNNVTFAGEDAELEYMSGSFPVLTVQYISSTGLENIWSYADVSTTEHGAAFVNRYTGNLVVTETVMATTGARLPMNITLTYNSLKYDKMKYTDSTSDYMNAGTGFIMNFQQRIDSVEDETLIDAGYKYIYTDADGTEHYLRQKDDSTTEWVDEEGLGLTLKETGSSGNGIYLHAKDGQELHFYQPDIDHLLAGMLFSLTDIHGNKIRYYGTQPFSDCELGAITSIKDGSGRMIYITYAKYSYGGKTYLRPTKITDHEDYEYIFTYSSQYLSKITYPEKDGNITTFTYSGGRLQNVTDSIGTKTTVGYVSSSGINKTRVSYIEAYVKNDSATYDTAGRLDFEYGIYNTTEETDLDDRTSVYQFDNIGRVTGIIAPDGSLGHIKYQTVSAPSGSSTAHADTAKNNAVLNSDISNAYVNNLMVNPNIETEANYYNFVDAGTGVSQSYDSTVSYLGERSIKVNHNGTGVTNSGKAQQVFFSEAVNTPFTFSAYVKTDNVTPIGDNTNFTKGASLHINFYNSSGVKISGTPCNTYITGTSDWSRISVTATAPAGTREIRVYCALRDSTGIAWFDCLQLENSGTMNDLNILENSDFSTSQKWTTSNFETSDTFLTSGQVKVTGAAGVNKYLYQLVPVNKANVGFSLYGKISSGTTAAEKSGRLCAVEIAIRYKNNSKIDYFTKSFNETLNDTQYVSVMAQPSLKNQEISTVGAYFIFRNNANTVYLDAMMLNIDQTGTVFAYDSDGNVVSSDDNAARNQTYTYNDANEITQYKDSKNEIYKYIYSETNKHKLVAVRSDQLGNGFRFEYDSFGNIIKTTMGTVDSNGNVSTSQPTVETSAEYDDAGNYIVSETNPAGKTTSYNVDENNGLIHHKYTPVSNNGDSSRLKTQYFYNIRNLLIGSVWGMAVDAPVISYMYDSQKRLSIIGSPTTSYFFEYDQFGNMTETRAGFREDESRLLSQNTYGDTLASGYARKGLVTSTEYGNGDIAEFTYDAYDRLTGKTFNDVSVFSLTYNNNGQLARRVDNAGGYTTDYAYDLAGRLVQSQQSAGRNARTTYSYDNQNRLKRQDNYIDGYLHELVYEYGEDDLLSKCWNGGYRFEYSYNTLNLPVTELITPMTGVTLKNTYEYDENDPTVIATHKYYKNNTLQDYYDYTYDNAGNISEIYKNNVLQSVYLYDEFGQLVRENSNARNETVIYSYDKGGNLTSVSVYPYTTGTPGTATSVKTYTYGNSQWKDLLTKYNGQDITYDEIGNPLQYRDGMSFEWSNGRQLTSLQKGTSVISYEYNGDGLRTAKTVGGDETEYYYDDNGRLIYFKNDDNAVWLYYGLGNAPMSMRFNGARYLYIKNIRGDVMAIANSAGTIYARYEYDAYGRVVSVTDGNGNDVSSQPNHIANVNPIRYRGYYYDTESGLYYLKSRYYDPATCRFINADGYISTGQGLLSTNMFAYCENNPVNKFDPTGNFALTATLGGIALWKIGGLIIGAVTALVIADTVAKNPPSLPSISLPKIESKSESDSDTKDLAPPKLHLDPVHHIVAKADFRAAESRKILRDVGIEPVTDPKNLVILPQGYHSSMHTTAYHKYVVERLRPVAGDRAGVEATLASLRIEILARSAVGIRWD